MRYGINKKLYRKNPQYQKSEECGYIYCTVHTYSVVLPHLIELPVHSIIAANRILKHFLCFRQILLKRWRYGMDTSHIGSNTLRIMTGTVSLLEVGLWKVARTFINNYLIIVIWLCSSVDLWKYLKVVSEISYKMFLLTAAKISKKPTCLRSTGGSVKHYIIYFWANLYSVHSMVESSKCNKYDVHISRVGKCSTLIIVGLLFCFFN